MSAVVRIKGLHWTADFAISRALGDAYESAGKELLVYFCPGDPEDPYDDVGPAAGSEILRYYPHVIGTRDEPVRSDSLASAWRKLTKAHPNAFVVCIESGVGDEESWGQIEVSDRGLRRRPSVGGELPPWLGDVGVYAIVQAQDRAAGQRPGLGYNQRLRVTDAVIDGQIRFLQKVKLYQPEL